jgi:hypothetical protein
VISVVVISLFLSLPTDQYDRSSCIPADASLV